eukprot:c49132_g1_i1 orf=153-359(+)
MLPEEIWQKSFLGRPPWLENKLEKARLLLSGLLTFWIGTLLNFLEVKAVMAAVTQDRSHGRNFTVDDG